MLALNLAGVAVLVAALAVAALAVADRRLPVVLDSADRPSVMVVDRGGRLLRAFTTAGGRWRLPVTSAEVDPRFLEMLIAYEDRRFREHRGVDPLALGRAVGQAVRHGRIVSGASTLTMQTARLIDERRDQSLRRKLGEMGRAVRLERRLTKREILDRYLNLAPYGGNLEGIRAASLAYFGREPARLTIAQAALLVALPQSPETRRPDRHPEPARRARDRVLDRLAAAGVLTAEAAATAKRAAVPTARRDVPRLAPHVARRVAARAPEVGLHRLTIDRDLQASLEGLAREHAGRHGASLSAAIVVADHESGDILASVGAADFLSERRDGHVDMTRAVRSPGSALKPFIYGLAFEAGLARPETLIDDVPARFGSYQPENFDDEFHGTVPIREALQRSLNVPAVAVLEAVGPVRLAVRLRQAGAELALPSVEAPSLAIGLGGLGMRLVDLAHLYAALARGGAPVALRLIAPPELGNAPADGEAPADGKVPAEGEAPADGEVRADAAPPAPRLARLMHADAAGLVTGVLIGTPPPRNAVRGRIAYKTGTSYGHRDAWAVGYDGRHVVAAWIGRPDATPVAALTGWHDAAPMLFDAFARIGVERVPLRTTASPSVSELPPPLRRFRRPFGSPGGTAAASPAATAPVRITYPPDGAEIALGGAADGAALPLAVSVHSASANLTFLVDNRPVAVPRFRREVTLPIATRGTVRITVLDPSGAADSVTVKLLDEPS